MLSLSRTFRLPLLCAALLRVHIPRLLWMSVSRATRLTWPLVRSLLLSFCSWSLVVLPRAPAATNELSVGDRVWIIGLAIWAVIMLYAPAEKCRTLAWL